MADMDRLSAMIIISASLIAGVFVVIILALSFV